MTLRRRIALLVAATVAIAVTLACVAAYVAVRGALRGEVDAALSRQASFVQARAQTLAPPAPAGLPVPPPGRGGPIAYAQVVGGAGDVVTSLGAPLRLPVGTRVRALAQGGTGRFFTDADVNGAHLRVLSVGTGDGALQLARSLDGADSVLARLRLALIAVVLAGVALAAALGRSLGRRVAERSVEAQRRLVADASHELRTPVTTLRTNIELLDEYGGVMSAAERGAVHADLRGQVEELGAIVNDIIELARGGGPPTATEDVRLDEIVAASVERARLHAPATRFVLRREPVVVEGVPERLGRAVNNLLDNAAQHGGGIVDVRVTARGVVVRDRGPGIPEADIAHVFDRFYRCDDARGRPGTGLGLAIVRQVAETHGGSVRAANAPGGGAEMTLALPACTIAAR